MSIYLVLRIYWPSERGIKYRVPFCSRGFTWLVFGACRDVTGQSCTKVFFLWTL